jgi:hypothetical protein
MLDAMRLRNTLLGILLAAVLAACSSYEGGGTGEANVVSPTNFRAGSGVITSVGVLPNANPNPAAGSSGKPDRNLYRVQLQMDNGGFQQVDVDNASFMTGQAVELTNDGRLVHVSGTQFNRLIGR